MTSAPLRLARTSPSRLTRTSPKITATLTLALTLPNLSAEVGKRVTRTGLTRVVSLHALTTLIQLPDGIAGVNTFSVLNDENTEILRNLLENPYPDNSSYSGANETAHRENFEKMQATFNVCMDQDTIKKAGVKPLQTLLSELPSSQQYGSDNSITNTLIWLQKYGVDALVSSGTGVSFRVMHVACDTS